jgi:hypothetical protein
VFINQPDRLLFVAFLFLRCTATRGVPGHRAGTSGLQTKSR